AASTATARVRTALFILVGGRRPPALDGRIPSSRAGSGTMAHGDVGDQRADGQGPKAARPARPRRQPRWGRDGPGQRMTASFIGLACLAALNPKVLVVDLLLIGNRRPVPMFVFFMLGGIGLAVAIGLLDVFVLRADAIQAQGSTSAVLDLA